MAFTSDLEFSFDLGFNLWVVASSISWNLSYVYVCLHIVSKISQLWHGLESLICVFVQDRSFLPQIYYLFPLPWNHFIVLQGMYQNLLIYYFRWSILFLIGVLLLVIFNSSILEDLRYCFVLLALVHVDFNVFDSDVSLILVHLLGFWRNF